MAKAAHPRRFADVYYLRGDRLYAAELSTGVVKIGRTSNARHRLMALDAECKRELGPDVRVARYHIGPQLTTIGQASSYELRLIEGFAVLYPPLEGRREFFPGLPFSVACRAVDDPLSVPPVLRIERAPLRRGRKPGSLVRAKCTVCGGIEMRHGVGPRFKCKACRTSAPPPESVDATVYVLSPERISHERVQAFDFYAKAATSPESIPQKAGAA